MASGLIFIKKQNKNTAMLSMLDTVLPKWQKRKKNHFLRWWFWCFYQLLEIKNIKKTSVHSHTVPKLIICLFFFPLEEASLCLLYSKPLENWGPRLSQLLLYSQCQVHYTLAYLTFFFLVLPVYCYQPISLHLRAHMLSHVIPWTSAHQTPLSMDFSRQEYWSGLPFPSPLFNF